LNRRFEVLGEHSAHPVFQLLNLLPGQHLLCIKLAHETGVSTLWSVKGITSHPLLPRVSRGRPTPHRKSVSCPELKVAAPHFAWVWVRPSSAITAAQGGGRTVLPEASTQKRSLRYYSPGVRLRRPHRTRATC
jgi:hypothetical protein